MFVKLLQDSNKNRLKGNLFWIFGCFSYIRSISRKKEVYQVEVERNLFMNLLHFRSIARKNDNKLKNLGRNETVYEFVVLDL
jgi:hypothetical protein